MSYGAQPAQLDDDAGEDGYPSLADIARQETDGGRLVVRFLVDAMQGQLEDAKPCHRLDAARQLLKLGMDDARAYVADNGLAPSNRNASNNRNGHYQPAGSPRTNEPYPPLNQELADFIRLQTEGGKAAVRFLVDVMRGDLEGFKPHHRLSAAKELLRLCRDDHHDCDNDDDGGDDDDEEDEETYPHGLHKTLYDAYQDDEAKLGKKPSMQSTNYSPPYLERREARAAARDRPGHHDRDEETYPGDTLHKIYDTHKDDPDELLEAIKREIETYPGYQEREEARAAVRAWRDAEFREAGLRPPPRRPRAAANAPGPRHRRARSGPRPAAPGTGRAPARPHRPQPLRAQSHEQGPRHLARPSRLLGLRRRQPNGLSAFHPHRLHLFPQGPIAVPPNPHLQRNDGVGVPAETGVWGRSP